MSPTAPDAEQILILAPVGRDASLLKATLGQTAFACQVVADAQALRLALQGETGALLLTEEALSPPVLQVLQGFLASQAVWSNVPVVLLVDEHQFVAIRRTLLDLLGAESQLTLLVRPVAPTTLVAMLQAALWARRRQYEVRTLLKQLARQNETLEQRVAERTAELERRNHELDQFTHIAAHDLRTPLRGIDHLASWITQDAAAVLPEPSKVHLAKLRARIHWMDDLLTALLSYARAGRQRQPVERVDTAMLLHEILAMLEPPAGFTVSLAEPLPILATERIALEMVLRNLLDNALKHHDRPTEGRLLIAAQDRGEFIEFSVTDNGSGIATEHQERIFHLFQRVNPRPHNEGNGMGLALVKRIVESYGGTIQVVSSLGQGATFRFTWPKLPPP